MTVEQQVDSLATSVDELRAAVVTKKATLDASVVDAQSATTQAQNAKTNTLSARDQAGAFKDAAYTAAQSAASAVAYQDLTALAAEKAITAVDVFIYDTSKDSDGGAWRHRCAGTSWFNEPLNTATRGARREFPAVALIVAEVNRVTIYDGVDPALPMWMVFNDGGGNMVRLLSGGTSVSFLNGKMAVGSSINGLQLVDFVSEKAERYNPPRAVILGSIIQRNLNLSAQILSGSLINAFINDVAMTVLSDTPIDPATGLPVPTIAVATEGGASVIKNDGTVISAQMHPTQGGRVSRLDILGTKVALSGISSTAFWGQNVWDYETDQRFLMGSQTPSIGLGANSANERVLFAGRDADYIGRYFRGGQGLGVINWQNFAASLILGRTSTYATGWMPGNIRGAFLADTDDADMVGSELVTNGTFDTDISGWDASDPSLVEWDASGAIAVSTVTTSDVSARQTITTVVGQRYRWTVSFSQNSGTWFWVSSFAYGNNNLSQFLAGASSGSVVLEFTAQSTTTYLTILNYASGPTTTLYDNVSVHAVDADRSVNARGLVVNGTITRAPVASGAELIAYSGFSETNYLEGTDATYADTLYALGWEQTAGVWEFKHGVVSAASIDGLSITGATLKIAGTKPKALVRVTATTPTAAQLAKIQADERFLFQADAACTLYGASDAVTALAHDPDTGLLHVGTSAGRSVFKGLRRVAKTTVPVTKAIAAAGGMVVEE